MRIRLPLLVLDGSPLITGLAKQVSQSYDLAPDPTDIETATPVTVRLDVSTFYLLQ
jgi:hypothetical protein